MREPLDLDAIEARHLPRVFELYGVVAERCVVDADRWPCDAVGLIARVQELEAEGCPYCTLIAELEAKVAALEAEVAGLRAALP